MTAQYLGAFNGSLPQHEASGKLIVDFSRNPKAFKLSKYCQYVPTKKVNQMERANQGVYYVMSTGEAVRLPDAAGKNMAWADGDPRPRGTVNEKFEPFAFRTQRHAPGFEIGYDTAKSPSWNVIAQRNRMTVMQLMTLRTAIAATALTTSGNHLSDHVEDVASSNSTVGTSGSWAASTGARQDIKRSLLYAAEKINLQTNGVVQLSDMQLIIQPKDASVLAETQEMSDFIKNTPDAAAYLKGELKGENLNAQWGLPKYMHGVEIVVEDAVKNTAKKGATDAKARVWPSGSAVLTSRIGALEAEYDEAPSFSSITCFLREELNIEMKDDSWNRRHLGSVVDDYYIAFTAPVASFLFTGIIG
jgi:hypothetical protein